MLFFFSSKAVPNGALAWYLDQSIAARVAKYHYGSITLVPWDCYDLEAALRPRIVGYLGELMTSGGWSCIVAKVNRP
jgi:hypothetical protein